MKRIFFFAVLQIIIINGFCQDNTIGKSVVSLDLNTAINLSNKIPFLILNLNNYKYHSNPILTAGKIGEWDEKGIERVVVLRVAYNDWRMWYACLGKIRNIGYATSKDGINWTKYAHNPVLTSSEKWENNFLSPSGVVQLNGRFYLYYWSPGHVYVNPATGIMPKPKMKYICIATSADGINWTKMGEIDGRKGAVLGPNPTAINEDSVSGGSGVDAAKVFYLPEEKTKPWKMIYTAFGLHGQWNGIAESEDGIIWDKVKAPIANHSGFYTSATGVHHNSGQTIRCPIRIGSIWAGLSFELDNHDCAPMFATSLDNWVTSGVRTFYSNQDYEKDGLHPWCLEADNDWFYLYYSTNHGGLGLANIPKRSIYQPVAVWEKQQIEIVGLECKIFEPDRFPFSLNLLSTESGKIEVLVKNPNEKSWLLFESYRVTGSKLFNMQHLPATTFRLRFIPINKPALVTAWLNFN